jgi:hypothetical protein
LEILPPKKFQEVEICIPNLGNYGAKKFPMIFPIIGIKSPLYLSAVRISSHYFLSK